MADLCLPIQQLAGQWLLRLGRDHRLFRRLQRHLGEAITDCP